MPNVAMHILWMCTIELLAPKSALFFSAEWTLLGDKVVRQHEIATATRIDPDFLTQFQPVGTASVAKRMSWAATRQCTRAEDFAYCLMGLFDVNMPMLYGEGGTRAFLRLQEEIMKSTDDHSIFAWAETDPTRFPNGHGLLAESPKAFLRSGSHTPVEDYEESQPFFMTNRGLNITFRLTALGENKFAAALACSVTSEHTDAPDMDGFPAIYLRRLPTGSADSSQYVRVDCAKLGKIHGRGTMQQVYVRQNVRSTSDKLFRCVKLRKLYTTNCNFELIDIHSPRTDWNAKHAFSAASSYAQKWVPSQFSTAFELIEFPKLTVALLFRRVVDGSYFTLLLGASTDFSLGFQFRTIIGSMSSSSSGLLPGWHQFLPVEESALGHVEPRGSLKPAGHPWLTDRHRVGCDVHTFTKADRKTYYVDISIEDIVWGATVEEAKGTVKKLPEPGQTSRSRTLLGLLKKT
nr:vegetative incompatibility protein het-e-1 [Quercus suber]